MSSASVTARQARAVTRAHARTFSLACRLLPRSVRADVYRLYMVFRTLDDLVDEHRPEALDRLRALQAWTEGQPAASPETITLSDLCQSCDLPRSAFADFADGMLSDLSGEPIRSDAALDLYCYRVAGTVGLVMAALLSADRRGTAAAIALGKAMQLTNILRDLDEDLAAGRRYLPVDPAELRPGCRSDTLRRYIAQADALYLQGFAGLSYLSAGRLSIWSAAVMYREILRQIERDGLGRQAGRATVGSGQKARALLMSTASYRRGTARIAASGTVTNR